MFSLKKCLCISKKCIIYWYRKRWTNSQHMLWLKNFLYVYMHYIPCHWFHMITICIWKKLIMLVVQTPSLAASYTSNALISVAVIINNKVISHKSRDHFVYAPSQWNVASLIGWVHTQNDPCKAWFLTVSSIWGLLPQIYYYTGLDTNGCPLGKSKFILMSDNLNICLWLSACQVEKINQLNYSWSKIYQRLSQPEARFRKYKHIDLQCTRSCKFYLFNFCSKENWE